LHRLSALIGLASFVAAAVAGLPASGQQRPPVAAPITTVDVNALPLVRPEAQALEDFLSGLIGGLLGSSDVEGLSVVIVKGGDVLLAKGYGSAGSEAVNPDLTQFHLGSLSGLLTDVAAMQLVEQGHILLDEDVGAALSERDRKILVGDLLVGQAKADPNLLDSVVAHVSGQDTQTYIRDHVLAPVGMTHSGFDKTGVVATTGDMGRFLLAMLNDDANGGAHVLQPATIEQMERMKFTHHAALAGLTLGFAEMQRNGWRGVQRDGEGQGFQARLVMMPEIHTGYFIAINGKADPGFWRTLDGALFDRLFPMRETEELAISIMPAPTAKEADAAVGTYALVAREGYDFLRAPRAMRIHAGTGGSLVLWDGETTTLRPHAGGFWRSENGNIRVLQENGDIVIDTRVYKRDEMMLVYIVLGALAALGLIGFAAYRIMRA
jgi:CubicO group peptidase (beta-lactamase class C family)